MLFIFSKYPNIISAISFIDKKNHEKPKNESTNGKLRTIQSIIKLKITWNRPNTSKYVKLFSHMIYKIYSVLRLASF